MSFNVARGCLVRRAFATAALAVSIAFLALPAGAGAGGAASTTSDTGVALTFSQPSYTGEGTIVALSFGEFLASSSSGPIPSALAGTELHAYFPFNSITYTGACDPAGESVITFSASGAARGPYAGTFTLSGSVTIGPQNRTPPIAVYFDGPVGAVVAFTESLTIQTPDGTTVTGTKSLNNNIGPADTFTPLSPDWFSFGQCVDTSTSYGPQALGFVVSSDYVSTITFREIDLTAPVLTMPSSVTADATGPAGATVSYTVTATDNLDPDPAVSCAPPSESVFAIGMTTVDCTATDAAGNNTTGQFQIVVRGALDQAAELLTSVTGVGPGNALTAEVERILAHLAQGQTGGACRDLSVFVQQVLAMTKGEKPILSQAQADALTTRALNIRAVLAC